MEMRQNKWARNEDNTGERVIKKDGILHVKNNWPFHFTLGKKIPPFSNQMFGHIFWPE